nr:unnamed protein product [Spirometra erinaceieuropaei]
MKTLSLEESQQTFFTFNDRTYEKIKRTPMGSPISSLVAELVLQELEKVAFDHYEPVFWRRSGGDDDGGGGNDDDDDDDEEEEEEEEEEEKDDKEAGEGAGG